MDGLWKLLTQFLVLSGLRIGEAIDLTIDDIDIENRIIDVNSTFSLTTFKSSSVKTEKSNRQVYIQDELMTVVESVQACRSDFPDCKAFFPAQGGKLSYNAYRKYLREHSENVLGRRITPHYLRHSHVAYLAEAGIPLEQIARRLGHDSKITREVYFHVTEKMRDKENERIRNLAILPL